MVRFDMDLKPQREPHHEKPPGMSEELHRTRCMMARALRLAVKHVRCRCPREGHRPGCDRLESLRLLRDADRMGVGPGYYRDAG